MKNRRCPACGESVAPGNFCTNCGRRLTTPSQLRSRVAKLEGGIRNYLECYYKKQAGSTIQYGVNILENALDK